MPERRVTVASKVGLHARPAALVAKAAAAQSVKITIRKDDTQPVEAGSILGLMTLGAAHGDEVVLSAEGEGAEAALDHLVQLVGSDLDES
ncbi:phosphocarrier protein [Saccharopolyspora erythraea NRRL 2338]|uniref:Phosphocarrier protein HPr n=2 Tax=Saccharopolyspora erythraea TaxID=1836 RepID=A4FBD9_SACEN|nr:HPr family phosphocarrier protein [Saccharopolyspora erythraea]EQD81538.1 phosphotransferase [Saccharopolyspora erythraea D]PFG95146.1 phosphocarrier protein [Saccharopolyspora erythraea NRRL 2338]QRK91816.1 HPr family phosphocarrier protein [Saccharopolyspora erythraea]QUH01598.1 HPr family phosphocarrier protein [Saccharopolyspora erythraea]CAM01364.1 phosphocarrier protein hpr [Saccharopolyspora erythraea NRRL 2338]